MVIAARRFASAAGCAAFIWLGAVSGPALAQSADTAVRDGIRSVDVSPQWTASVETVSLDPATQATVARGITIASEQSPGIKLSLDTLTIRGFAQAPDGAFSASDIGVNRVEIIAGPMTLTLDDLKLSGLAVPSLADIRFDQERPFTSIVKGYAVAARAKLDQGRVTRMRFNQNVAGMTSDVAYDNLVLDHLGGGKLDLFAAGPISSKAPSNDGLVTFDIERIETRKMDLDAVVQAFDPDRYQGGVGDGQWRQVSGLVSYRNFNIGAPGTRIAIGDMTMEDFRLRQPPQSFAPLFDQLIAHPDAPSSDVQKLLGDHVVDLLASMAVGRIGYQDIDIASSGIDRFRIGELYLKDLSIDGLGEFGVGDVRVSIPDQATVDLQRFAFGGLAFPGAERIKAAIAAAQRGQEPDPIPLIPRLGFIELVGLKAAAAGQPSTSIDRSRLDLGRYVGPIPTSINFDLQALNVDVSAIDDPKTREVFTGLGYKRLTVDYGFKVDWREADEGVNVSNLRVAVKDAGSITAELSLTGLRRAALERPDQMAAVLPSLLFTSAKVAVTDQSLLNRVIAMQAQKLKITPDQLRTQVAGAMPFFLMVLGNPDFQGKLAAAFQAFMKTPGTLTIVARPKNPVPFLTVLNTIDRSPQRLPDLLSLEVTTGP